MEDKKEKDQPASENTQEAKKESRVPVIIAAVCCVVALVVVFILCKVLFGNDVMTMSATEMKNNIETTVVPLIQSADVEVEYSYQNTTLTLVSSDSYAVVYKTNGLLYLYKGSYSESDPSTKEKISEATAVNTAKLDGELIAQSVTSFIVSTSEESVHLYVRIDGDDSTEIIDTELALSGSVIEANASAKLTGAAALTAAAGAQASAAESQDVSNEDTDKEEAEEAATPTPEPTEEPEDEPEEAEPTETPTPTPEPTATPTPTEEPEETASISYNGNDEIKIANTLDQCTGSSSGWGQAWGTYTTNVSSEYEFDPSQVKEGSAFIVEFSTDSDSAQPLELIFQSWSDGAGDIWAKIAPAQVADGVALFTYEDINAAYTAAGGTKYSLVDAIQVGDTNTNLTVTSLIFIPDYE